MIRTRSLAAALSAFLLLAQAPAPRSAAEDLDRVIVSNFPKVQQIAGSVRVGEPVPQSEVVRRLDVVVPPVLGGRVPVPDHLRPTAAGRRRRPAALPR
jgi:hypothetical protein